MIGNSRIAIIKYPQICPFRFFINNIKACGQLPISKLKKGYHYTNCNTTKFPENCPQKTFEEFIKANKEEILNILKRN